ncbi:MAG: hypothetical protein QM227_01110 [Bacillota bacterium]|jgi:hypothetical protein|nr:hypothetical protein [Bacillota bacterium]NLL60025.1 hypothetical protein [Tissierellia bacterium]
MKKISYILIIITLLTLLTACGAKQKMEEKIAEKIIEQAIGGADIDIDGDEITIKSEEGDVTFGSTEWPDSQLSAKIPEFKKGNIVSVMNSEAYMLVIIEDVEADDFMDYYNKLKGEFDKESYEAKSADTIAYTGKNEEGIGIMASYTVSDKTASISASTGE